MSPINYTLILIMNIDLFCTSNDLCAYKYTISVDRRSIKNIKNKNLIISSSHHLQKSFSKLKYVNVQIKILLML